MATTMADEQYGGDQAVAAADRAALMRERLGAIIARLDKEAEERVQKRDLVEKRWLADLAQYHGKYEDKILKDLTDAKKSKLFINQTRPKTNAMEARLSDMLFPTDDKNYGIQPTPVPELTIEAEQAAMRAAELKQQAARNPQDPTAKAAAQQAERESAAIQARMEEARKRARAMEEEIDDILRECRYNVQAREVIHDACKLGTGIMKGPVIGGRNRRTWTLDPVSGEFTLNEVQDKRPMYWRVDPWAFFPDFDALSMEDCESVFERHLMNAKQLRRLAKQPGFDTKAIGRLLMDKPRSTTPHYISDLRSITGAYHDSTADRYHVWEYHGPLSAEDMRDIAMITRGESAEEFLAELGIGDADPLQEINAVIWFCQGELLKFGIHQLDSGEPIYSVFCLEKDEAGIFGFGIPYLMRDSQSALNSAWRIMLDNAGLSSGPQIEVDPEVVEPVNGQWVLEPRKIWKRRPAVNVNAPGFRTYNIESHQGELANIIELAKRNIDDETSIPVIAQGEQGAHITKTAHGMSILMNSVNVVFRRIVKNWDDDMTTPNIRRLYDWLMQFSPKEHIKGDFEVDARGSSVLLVREMQSANLLAFLVQFGAHPTLAGFLKGGGLPALRRLVQTMMIPADELVMTDEELAAAEAKAAEQPPQPDPAILKIEAELNKVAMQIEAQRELAMIERETAMLKLAAEMNMDLERIAATLQGMRMQLASKERIFAAEAAIEQRLAERGVANGSGGYISAGQRPQQQPSQQR